MYFIFKSDLLKQSSDFYLIVFMYPVIEVVRVLYCRLQHAFIYLSQKYTENILTRQHV